MSQVWCRSMATRLHGTLRRTRKAKKLCPCGFAPGSSGENEVSIASVPRSETRSVFSPGKEVRVMRAGIWIRIRETLAGGNRFRARMG